MVEFAGITAALSLLSTSLGTLQARIVERLAGSNAAALQQAVAGARTAGLPPASARAAYARAPYARPALRYVYATAWASGAKHQAACALARLDSDGGRGAVQRAVRADATLAGSARRLHLTVSQVATAFARGFLSACGG